MEVYLEELIWTYKPLERNADVESDDTFDTGAATTKISDLYKRVCELAPPRYPDAAAEAHCTTSDARSLLSLPYHRRLLIRNVHKLSLEEIEDFKRARSSTATRNNVAILGRHTPLQLAFRRKMLDKIDLLNRPEVLKDWDLGRTRSVFGFEREHMEVAVYEAAGVVGGGMGMSSSKTRSNLSEAELRNPARLPAGGEGFIRITATATDFAKSESQSDIFAIPDSTWDLYLHHASAGLSHTLKKSELQSFYQTTKAPTLTLNGDGSNPGPMENPEVFYSQLVAEAGGARKYDLVGQGSMYAVSIPKLATNVESISSTNGSIVTDLSPSFTRLRPLIRDNGRLEQAWLLETALHPDTIDAWRTLG